MNGLDRDEAGFGFRSGAIYRNDSPPDSVGWFFYVGSEQARGPYDSKAAAVKARDAYLGGLN